MVDHKGIDLALKALAKTTDIQLDISGDGEKRAELEALATSLGVVDRVNFLGWLPYDDLVGGFKNYRAYVFPSLAEANGIVMQEAMMIGLPVITLRWGGPGALSTDDGAVYVEPTDEASVVADIAAAMTDLADNPNCAEAISIKGRELAEARFKWDDVAASWMAVYPD
jgi:glycosyltransferase involved in cell wall biosynthesis